MPSQFLSVISEFILAFLDLSDQRKEGMIILFLIQLLREEGDDIHVRFFLNFDNDIVNFLCFIGSKSNADRFYGDEQLPDSMIDGSKGKFLRLKGLPNEVVSIDDFFVLNVLQLLRLHVEPEGV
jgi:hypothetical protein